MKFDLHTHHDRCGHARGNIEDYIKAAIEQGLQVIGISDHSPYFHVDEDHFAPVIAMAKSEFPNYIEDVLMLQKKYAGKIDVLLGIESDFFPGNMSNHLREYQKYPFDYLIGSVHRIRSGKSIFNRNLWKATSERQQRKIKDEYYEDIRESAHSGLFDILGHIDAMKGYYPEFSDIPTNELDNTLQVIGEKGLAIEVNTSGKTKDVGGWYPADDILQRAFYYDVSISFGSDAHDPHRIGDDYDLVAKRLKEIGFKEMVYYKQRRRMSVPL